MVVILHRNWTQIKHLSLDRCGINDDSIDALLKVEWPNLAILLLNNNKLSCIGINKMVQKQWKQLNYLVLCTQHLNIAYNGIQQQGMLALSKSNNMNKMKKLWLGNICCILSRQQHQYVAFKVNILMQAKLLDLVELM